MHHRQVIRADPDLPAILADDLGEGVTATLRKRARAKPSIAKTPEWQAFPPPRRSRPGRGRAEGQGRAIPCSPPAPASRFSTPFCAAIRPPPARCARRLALQSAAASAKILRLNADEGALRDLRFAVGDALGPAANLLRLWRDLAGRPPSLDPGRLATRRRGSTWQWTRTASRRA